MKERRAVFGSRLFSTKEKTTTLEGKREYMKQYMVAYRKESKINEKCVFIGDFSHIPTSVKYELEQAVVYYYVNFIKKEKDHSWNTPLITPNHAPPRLLSNNPFSVFVLNQCGTCKKMREQIWDYKRNIDDQTLGFEWERERENITLFSVPEDKKWETIIISSVINKKLQRNLYILNNAKGKRLDATIYRLYRYLDYPISSIAFELGRNEGWVRNRIGVVFSRMCKQDDKCVFKEILNGEVKNRNWLV